MKIIEPKIIILNPPSPEDVIRKLIVPARNCYQSFDRSEDNVDLALIQHLVEQGHTSILEQLSLQYIMVSSRGIHNEDVRHRTGISHAAESSRWVNYSHGKFGSEISVINPLYQTKTNVKKIKIWYEAMKSAEKSYFEMLSAGASPQEARDVLPLSLKISDVQTANFTGLRSRFNQRCAKTAHPEYRRLMLPFLKWCCEKYSMVFADQYRKFSLEYERFESLYGTDLYADISVVACDIEINELMEVINK